MLYNSNLPFNLKFKKMKKTFICIIIVNVLFIKNIYSQNDTIVRNSKSFETEAGFLSSDLSYWGLGMNYKIKNKLYLYPNIRFLGGIYKKTTSLSPILYGGNFRYYFYEKKTKQPQLLHQLSFYLSSGISGNTFIKDDSDKYQIKSNGLEMEFSIGMENLVGDITLMIEIGYASLPVLIDTKAAQSYQSSPPLMDNVRSNLGGIFLSTKIGWFSFGRHRK